MENESLIIALTIVSIVSCVALFVNWAGNRHIPGLLVFSLANIYIIANGLSIEKKLRPVTLTDLS
ncbi:MAG: hypothetical protein CMQ07_07980 [Gammaproteobacteria bacterium]|nr:hypothetical protein [Gammaproteobacteria bacterium]